MKTSLIQKVSHFCGCGCIAPSGCLSSLGWQGDAKSTVHRKELNMVIRQQSCTSIGTVTPTGELQITTSMLEEKLASLTVSREKVKKEKKEG